MKYLSVCSGIEAATVAWDPLGFEPVAFSEVEPFPSAVLAQHYPDVPNLGDMTQIDGRKYNGSVDLLVGGTPCQSFSVAGLRGGMADPRGNLALAFLGLVDRIRPKYFVWENVPGVLSSSGGRDFGSFVSAVAQLGYRGGWRVLDAQYFGLAQRRKRVFFVGCSPAAERGPREILFERESLCGDSPPSREAGEGASAGTRGGAPIAHALNGHGGAGRFDAQSETLIPTVLKIRADCEGGGKGPLVGEDQSFTLATGGDQTLFAPRRPSHWDGNHPHPTLNQSAHNSGGIGASNQEVFSQRGGGLVPTAFVQNSRDEVRLMGGDGELAGALAAEPGAKQQTYIAFDARQDPVVTGEQASTLGTRDTGHGVAYPLQDVNRLEGSRAQNGLGVGAEGGPAHTLQSASIHGVAANYAVRRLTPIECERLQGFPDDYTRIPWRGKASEDCPDGPRYKALGNSMAVTVMRWIGERLRP